MVNMANPATAEIDDYLIGQQNIDLLRFITCGSVDDGKSTLIGRLLYESHAIFEDQLAALETDSLRSGTQGSALDLALLVDGLAAEREQGITIDVAYRFFTTDKRKFIIADTPGHEQYTRNMVTGASNCDAAIILIDARKGVLTQTRRHSYLVSLLGVNEVVLVVNKLDLVDYSQAVFERIDRDYREFAARIGLANVSSLPVSALRGDNIVTRSPNTPWYQGPTLLHHLETIKVDSASASRSPFRMPVQWVNRANSEFRGLCGPVVGGALHTGDTVRILPSGSRSRIARIVTHDGDHHETVAGQSTTITLTDDVDVSRGDLLCADDAPAHVADRLMATVVWMGEGRLVVGRPYRIKIGTTTVDGTVAQIRYRIDVNTLAQTGANELALNEIGVCDVDLDRPVAFDSYADNRNTGGFIVIDRMTNDTVGAGMAICPLTGSHDLYWHAGTVDKAARARLNGQRPAVVWLTGLSGAGKSTIANQLERRLHALGKHTYLLDGDNVRHGLNHDLGFTEADRVENVRRVAEVAALMVDAGLIVLVAMISPFRAEREMARAKVAGHEFYEVFVDTPLAVAERRDPKGLYRRARRGELAGFTGIDSPYEPPSAPDIHINTTAYEPAQAVEIILGRLRESRLID